MTIVKDPPKKALVPEVIGPIERKDSRRERPGEFGASGFGNRAVYQGERPIPVDKPSPVVLATSPPQMSQTVPVGFAARGVTRREAMFLKALVGQSSKKDAWRMAFPKYKGTDATVRQRANEMYKAIVAKIGEDEIFEAMGIGKLATMEKLRQLKDAKCVKAFIVPETGEVVEAGPYEDNTTQMNATKLLTQIHKMVPDEKGGGGGTVVVNIVQYNPPGTPTWPGGGRA